MATSVSSLHNHRWGLHTRVSSAAAPAKHHWSVAAHMGRAAHLNVTLQTSMSVETAKRIPACFWTAVLAASILLLDSKMGFASRHGRQLDVSRGSRDLPGLIVVAECMTRCRGSMPWTPATLSNCWHEQCGADIAINNSLQPDYELTRGCFALLVCWSCPCSLLWLRLLPFLGAGLHGKHTALEMAGRMSRKRRTACSARCLPLAIINMPAVYQEFVLWDSQQHVLTNRRFTRAI